jgi:hypothetical protein
MGFFVQNPDEREKYIPLSAGALGKKLKDLTEEEKTALAWVAGIPVGEPFTITKQGDQFVIEKGNPNAKI